MPSVLGLDSSTQSLSAVILETDSGAILHEESVSFGDDLASAGWVMLAQSLSRMVAGVVYLLLRQARRHLQSEMKKQDGLKGSADSMPRLPLRLG